MNYPAQAGSDRKIKNSAATAAHWRSQDESPPRKGPRWDVSGTIAAPAPAALAGEHPVWFAALLASKCCALSAEGSRTVDWQCIAGRAIYTNERSAPESIHPLGVDLLAGHTLSVWWSPGESSYTLEIYPRLDFVA